MGDKPHLVMIAPNLLIGGNEIDTYHSLGDYQEVNEKCFRESANPILRAIDHTAIHILKIYRP